MYLRFLLLLSLFSIHVYADSQKEPEIKSALKAFEEVLPGWVMLSQKTSGYELSFIGPNESETSWSKMISYGFMPYEVFGSEIPPADFAELFHRQIKSQCPGMKWTVVEHEPHHELVHWETFGCGSGVLADQVETVAFYAGADGIHHVHFLIKDWMVNDQVKNIMKNIVTHEKIKQLAQTTKSTSQKS